MDISLSAKPKSPIIILGFPGVGLVGPIVTEFLIEHMKTRRIGVFEYDELPPTAAVHKGALVHPMSIHYSEEHNTIILYTILKAHGHEWKIAKEIRKLAKELNAKEILCLDGANAIGEAEEQVYAHGNPTFMDIGARPLEESVITGVPGAMLLTGPVTCLFAGTHAEIPDSKAAANVVRMLDKYLGLNVDPNPLLAQAQEFEGKLKGLLEQSQKILKDQDRKNLDYLG